MFLAIYLWAGTLLCIINQSSRMTKYSVGFKNPLVGLLEIYYNRSIGTKVSIHDKMLIQCDTIGEYNVDIIR